MNKTKKDGRKVRLMEDKIMKTTTIYRGQSVQELFFLISPPRHIMSDVSVLKDDVHYLIGHQLEDRYSKAHISLFKFTDNQEHINDIIHYVESRACQFKPFNVFLKDFGFFYTGQRRTIYMDIVNKYPIREIFEKLVKEDPQFTPHITIAKNLAMDDFLKCWPYLSGLNYSNQHFLCDRITVLARSETKWVHYKDILFDQK